MTTPAPTQIAAAPYSDPVQTPISDVKPMSTYTRSMSRFELTKVQPTIVETGTTVQL